MRHAPGARIVLVRHGETEANVRRCFADSDDIPLTPAGRLQARRLALRLLREYCPEVLVSSSFLRAIETSEIVAQVLGLATEAIPGIHERNFGSLRGHPYERLDERLDAMPTSMQPWLWSPPGGESLDDVRRRAIQAIDGLLVRYPGREIVIVSHGAVIQAVCAHIERHWTCPGQRREQSVPPNCGLVTIACHSHGWELPARSGDWDAIAGKPESP